MPNIKSIQGFDDTKVISKFEVNLSKRFQAIVNGWIDIQTDSVIIQKLSLLQCV